MILDTSYENQSQRTFLVARCQLSLVPTVHDDPETIGRGSDLVVCVDSLLMLLVCAAP